MLNVADLWHCDSTSALHSAVILFFTWQVSTSTCFTKFIVQESLVANFGVVVIKAAGSAAQPPRNSLRAEKVTLQAVIKLAAGAASRKAKIQESRGDSVQRLVMRTAGTATLPWIPGLWSCWRLC